MGIKKYLRPGRVAWYVAAGAWAVFGAVTALVVYFTGEEQSALEAFWEPNKKTVAALGVLLAFIPPAAGVLTFLGVTQETASRQPLSKKRGAWYTLGALALAFGAVLFPLTYFSTDRGLMQATATLIPFCIPGLALLIFLLLTEQDTRKPWVRAQYEKDVRASRELWRDPAAAARFGMAAGAIWICAGGLFILLGFLAGFHLSWLVFVFAVALQLAVQSVMMKPNRGGEIQK